MKIPSLTEIQKELARRSYLEYCKYSHRGKWIPGKHLQYITGQIEDIIYRNVTENILIISMPPQHGKSQGVTETLPSYYLGKYPDRRIIEVSYGDDLARKFGRRNKQKIDEFGKELFNIELAKNSRSDTEFEIEGHRGSMISRGIMSGITGQPGDLIIIDDPIKNRQEAESETYRERIWEEFLNSIYTRLSADGIIILIMTRWHEDDLVGRLLQHMPKKCIEINIPLEAEENDILGRNIGEALFPEIGKDNEWLKDFKKVYMTQEGARAWSALMQGRPSPDEGSMFKKQWWRYWHYKGQDLPPVKIKVGGEIYEIQSEELPDKLDEQIQSWDCTFKDSDGSDFVAGHVWGRRYANKYLLHRVHDRMDIIKTMESIIYVTNKFPKATLKLIEDKANGPAIITMLKRKIGGLVPVNPEGGKLARASAVAPEVESKNVYLPHPQIAPWVTQFIETFASFPNVKHDDDVDAFSQALNRLQYHQTFEPRKVPDGFYTPGELEDLGYKNHEIKKVT